MNLSVFSDSQFVQQFDASLVIIYTLGGRACIWSPTRSAMSGARLVS